MDEVVFAIEIIIFFLKIYIFFLPVVLVFVIFFYFNFGSIKKLKLLIEISIFLRLLLLDKRFSFFKKKKKKKQYFSFNLKKDELEKKIFIKKKFVMSMVNLSTQDVVESVEK